MTTAAEMKDRTAVVTGATTGIGAEIAERLAAHAAHLVLVARTAERLETVAARLRREYAVDVGIVPLDLAAPGAPRELTEKLAWDGIEVEMLVNNAGVSSRGPVVASDPGQLRTVIDVDADALVETTALLVSQMVARRVGPCGPLRIRRA